MVGTDLCDFNVLLYILEFVVYCGNANCKYKLGE